MSPTTAAPFAGNKPTLPERCPLHAPGNRHRTGGKLLATFLQRPGARGKKKNQTIKQKQIKGTFSMHFSRLRYTGKQRAQPVSPRPYSAPPARDAELEERPPPPTHPEREQVRAPEWEGHPPRSLPVPGTAARSRGRPGRAHPGHQRALQEQLHELRHRHVHAEPRPRRTKRLRQPAAGAGDKGGARAHGARLQPRPPGESERMGAERGEEGGATRSLPRPPPGAQRCLVERSPTGRGGERVGSGDASGEGRGHSTWRPECAGRCSLRAQTWARCWHGRQRGSVLSSGCRIAHRCRRSAVSRASLPCRSPFRIQAVWPSHPCAPPAVALPSLYHCTQGWRACPGHSAPQHL